MVLDLRELRASVPFRHGRFTTETAMQDSQPGPGEGGATGLLLLLLFAAAAFAAGWFADALFRSF